MDFLQILRLLVVVYAPQYPSGMMVSMTRQNEPTPREETQKKMHGITRTEFHAMLKKASKPSKPSPK